MTIKWMLALTAAVVLAGAQARADDKPWSTILAPTGKLRVAVAVAPNPGAGNVARDADGKYRGISSDLGAELAKKAGVPVEFVPYPHSGALTDAADKQAWDIAFIPVDDERRKKVDFGAAHIVLQSTFLVAPASNIQTLAEVDRPGVRVVGIENTATARAAQASLKNVTVTHVKGPAEMVEMLQTDKADAIAQSRESLTGIAARVPGARVLDGAFLNSYVAIAVPKGHREALAVASAFIEEAKTSGLVRRVMDDAGMKSSVVAPAGVKP